MSAPTHFVLRCCGSAHDPKGPADEGLAFWRGTLRLADGGLETSLIFHQGLDLPHFAAFPLIEHQDGRAALRAYWQPYLALARERRAGFVVDTATWRANPDWASRLGHDAASLWAVNDAAARFARELATDADDVIVNGVVGPRGDGYVVSDEMTPDEAAAYHAAQISALVMAGVDEITGLTLTYPQEAIGIARAATTSGVPCAVSFTVETNGVLPSGHSLRAAIELVDDQTDHAPSGFMINCAHSTHLERALDDGPWQQRVAGIRCNASRLSHAELDAADGLDEDDPRDLADAYRRLLPRLPGLRVVGGCCGTDHRHVRAIAEACLPA